MLKHFGEVFGLEQSKLDKLMEEVCLYTSRITPPKFNKDTDSLDSWFNEVIKLLNEIEKVDVFDKTKLYYCNYVILFVSMFNL